MKLAARILLAVFIIIGAGFYYLTSDILSNVRVRYLEGVEEVMVDQARLLSSIISYDMANTSFSPMKLHEIFDDVYKTRFISKIYHVTKNRMDMRVYITGSKGMILFDSQKKAVPGEDYSQWRDVYLTLRGKYGARSTRENPEAEESSILYVAAPINVDGKITGVLTVAKPTTNINHFLTLAKQQIRQKSIIVVALVILLSVLVISYLTRPIKLLTRYANSISAGKKAVVPRLNKSEIGDMGRAFENMREALENRKYVEKYVQTLTHEIKSPVSAIKGAAELLGEDMSKEQRDRFLDNICNESDRIKRLVDRMLQLAALENMKSLKNTESFSMSDLIEDAFDQLSPIIESRNLRIMTDNDETGNINADYFLIRQAILNLVQNSIDFSLPGDTILLTSKHSENTLIIKITDQGPGIPDYALEKIFERFYSLQRPDTGKKSTGLGLNFVKEIVHLHNGTINLENLQKGGTCASMILPTG